MADAEPGRATTLGALLRDTARYLEAEGIEDPGYDSRQLVETLTSTTRRDSIADPGRPIEPAMAERIWRAMRRRAAGEPPHRILGAREFYGLRLALSEATLEPRPDTEALVDLVLPLARGIATETGACRLLDLGTGTGAIALALLSEVATLRATVTDIAPDALATASANAHALGLADRLTAIRSDWFDGVEGVFDLIVSNPPYIPTAEIGGLDREVRLFDPHRALDGGADGLDAYRTIAAGAGNHLAEGGHVALEIGAGQRAAVAGIFSAKGFALCEVGRDLAGLDRALLMARAAAG
ncbi:MAG: peptide chain release factor N(5)-glutamine methyltransferase [Mesorhizobium sp.]|nr:peptide chain release factor N(5)-glutamine methyltransferase [Mesorhizobium sp.]